ncbi:MAG: hypothetical protein GY803_32025 [Chloroflexi bacterium]|nr:hypothetical protein [Chloroflexota bacterium]
MSGHEDGRSAAQQNESGLEFYATWELDKAIAAFQAAAASDPGNPDYPLNLARAYARSGDFGLAMRALGDYLHIETKSEIAGRYERLFSSALDEVEQVLTTTMPAMEMSLPQIGKALQMWLEYRIAIGRRPLRIPQPEPWAAAVTYGVAKVNLLDLERDKIAAAYAVKEQALQKKYKNLAQTLDLMPADYRYYLGEENPLDQVVEAGETPEADKMLTVLERLFKNGQA